MKKNLKKTVTTVTTAGILLTSISPSFAAEQQGQPQKNIVPTEERQNQTTDELTDAEVDFTQENNTIIGEKTENTADQEVSEQQNKEINELKDAEASQDNATIDKVIEKTAKQEVPVQEQQGNGSASSLESKDARAINILAKGTLEGSLTTYKPGQPSTGKVILAYKGESLGLNILGTTKYIVKLPGEFYNLASTGVLKKYITGHTSIGQSWPLPPAERDFKPKHITVHPDRIVFENPYATYLGNSAIDTTIQIDFGKAIEETGVHIPQASSGYHFESTIADHDLIEWNIAGDYAGKWTSSNNNAEESVKVPDAPKVNEVTDKDTKVTGTAEPGST
ncbi:hypothetical protein COD78_31665, partial [Bacillus cereus]